MRFDHYGQRLATCSSDRKIKIWTRGNSDWQLEHEWSAHQASVWKVDWAHPEFGQLLASCSFDRSVAIWEDQGSDLRYGTKPTKEGWRNQAQLVDAREAVHDVKFAPRHLGLRLATASEDGYVRMYEAVDVQNLSHWPLQEEFLADRSGVTCLAWNGSRFDVPLVAVGGNSSQVSVWGYSHATRKWQLVVELQGHTDAVHDVSWAPRLARSHHLIATASKDRSVRIWRLDVAEGGRMQAEATQLAQTTHHASEVWRVEWNVAGTTLASSGDDGTVRLWQQDFAANWNCVSTIAGDLS